MRIRAANGKLYDPDAAAIIGKRTFSDGIIQTLHRSGAGSYFFYEVSEGNSKKRIVPTTYDEALEWANEYGYKNSVDTVMRCPDNQFKHFKVKLKECDLSRLKLIAKREGLTLKDTLDLIAIQYNGGELHIEKV